MYYLWNSKRWKISAIQHCCVQVSIQNFFPRFHITVHRPTSEQLPRISIPLLYTYHTSHGFIPYCATACNSCCKASPFLFWYFCFITNTSKYRPPLNCGEMFWSFQKVQYLQSVFTSRKESQRPHWQLLKARHVYKSAAGYLKLGTSMGGRTCLGATCDSFCCHDWFYYTQTAL